DPTPEPAAPASLSTELPLGTPNANEGTIPSPATFEGPVEYEQGTEKPLVTSFPAAASEPARPKLQNLPSDDELFGKPLVIAGQVIPFEQIRREVCLGQVGMAEIEESKLEIFLRQEVERRRKEGASDADISVSDPELEAFIKELEDDLKREYPDGSINIQDMFATLASNDPRQRLRFEHLFQKLFLPDDPAKFPPATMEAILKTPGGDSLLDHYKETFANSADGTRGKGIAERSFDSAMLQQVLQHLKDTAVIVRDPEPGVLFRVNGEDLAVDDIWRDIRPFVTTMEVRAAKQWITNYSLARAELQKAGTWLSDEEAAASYEALSGPYKDSIFSIENLAVAVKRFPSVERYKEYQRLYDSYARYAAKVMTPEELDKHAEFRTNKVVGQVSADVDVILCSAYDFKANRWKENGWAEAEARMKDVVNLLVEEQQPWDVLVERYSDFYQPPTPLSQQGQVDPNRAVKGRFRNVQRNNLLGELGENDYWCFLNGNSITDFVFFQQEVLSLGQPMRGPLGWYLPRLLRRTKPPQRLSMDPEVRDKLVRDDYIIWHLNEFCQELVRKNEVYGLEFPKN
ncbi:MAG: hypothetical protein ABL998_11310, partial [Planctomycetota bacterium]